MFDENLIFTHQNTKHFDKFPWRSDSKAAIIMAIIKPVILTPELEKK